MMAFGPASFGNYLGIPLLQVQPKLDESKDAKELYHNYEIVFPLSLLDTLWTLVLPNVVLMG